MTDNDIPMRPDPDDVIRINGHEISVLPAGFLKIESEKLALSFFNAPPKHVKIAVSSDIITITRIDQQTGRLYLKIDAPAEAEAAVAFFTRHGFIVESRIL